VTEPKTPKKGSEVVCTECGVVLESGVNATASQLKSKTPKCKTCTQQKTQQGKTATPQPKPEPTQAAPSSETGEKLAEESLPVLGDFLKSEEKPVETTETAEQKSEATKPVEKSPPPKGGKKQPPAQSPPPAKGKGSQPKNKPSPMVVPEPSNVTEEESEPKTAQTSAEPKTAQTSAKPANPRTKKGGNQPPAKTESPPTATVTETQDTPVPNVPVSNTEPEGTSTTTQPQPTADSTPVSPGANEYHCVGCNVVLTKDNATAAQLKKKNAGKCKQCVGQTAQQPQQAQQPKKKK